MVAAAGLTLCERLGDFSAVALSERKRDPLNQLASRERLVASRFRFSRGSWYFDRKETCDISDLREVRHVANIRSVVLVADVSDVAAEAVPAEALAERLVEAADWNHALQDLGQLSCSLRTCRVVARKLRKMDGPKLAQELSRCLAKRFAWRVQRPGRTADVTVHAKVKSGRLLLEVALLKHGKAVLGGGWPHQAMGHVEAWAMAAALRIRPGDVVLDPMCGKGSLLLEAATWFPDATFQGCDLDKSQLKLCRQNFRWLGRKAVLKRGDVTRPFGIPCRDKSVDKVVTAPPWNRQFRVKGDLEDFYRKMFQEIFRVLRPKGRLVLLASGGVVRRCLSRALDASQVAAVARRASVTAERRFRLSPAIEGLILVLDVADTAVPAAPEPPAHLANSTRRIYDHWRLLRAQRFPPLESCVEPPQTWLARLWEWLTSR
ncbi:unnamed protein product [Effrenium voratum]|uniref:Ribosomal RNA large subunit methyltransferase K/L-like methyltransferase domain-containing protein n=1 Tax=Effrenium voratum TaxID=2562239 RepID=A0AA36IH52_9DINO|nr:unnamed protein product [Effrenium voratum]